MTRYYCENCFTIYEEPFFCLNCGEDKFIPIVIEVHYQENRKNEE